MKEHNIRSMKFLLSWLVSMRKFEIERSGMDDLEWPWMPDSS